MDWDEVAAKVPAAQGRHAVPPEALMKFPGLHPTHATDTPPLGCTVPGAHLVQTDAPLRAEKLPVAHGEQ